MKGDREELRRGFRPQQWRRDVVWLCGKALRFFARHAGNPATRARAQSGAEDCEHLLRAETWPYPVKKS